MNLLDRIRRMFRRRHNDDTIEPPGTSFFAAFDAAHAYYESLSGEAKRNADDYLERERQNRLAEFRSVGIEPTSQSVIVWNNRGQRWATADIATTPIEWREITSDHQS